MKNSFYKLIEKLDLDVYHIAECEEFDNIQCVWECGEKMSLNTAFESANWYSPLGGLFGNV